MLAKVFNLFHRTKTSAQATQLTAQDPDDWRPSPSASDWSHYVHACTVCNAEISHDEYMLNACHTCGTHFDDKKLSVFISLSWRTIWNGKKWVYQVKTRDGSIVRDTLLKPYTSKVALSHHIITTT